MKKGHIISLLAVCLLIVLTGCWKKPDLFQVLELFQSSETISDSTLSTSFEGTQGLLDYAARLSAAGNQEAAAAVYASLEKVARKELDENIQAALEGEFLQEMQFLAEMLQDNRER